MTAEFNVWLLIVGLVVGAGLVWLVIMDSRRRESEVDEAERPQEAAWLSAVMADDGYDVSPEAAERLLLLHRAYLQAAPPDGAMDDDEGDDAVAAAEDGPADALSAEDLESQPVDQSTAAEPDATDGSMRPSRQGSPDRTDQVRLSG